MGDVPHVAYEEVAEEEKFGGADEAAIPVGCAIAGGAIRVG